MVDWSNIKHFTANEFTCHCGCGQNVIKQTLVDRLELVRSDYGKPITVTSGYRCPAHNKAVSTTGEAGPHTTGLAADIPCSGEDAWRIVKLALQHGFTGVGISLRPGADRFVHLDLMPRIAIWSY